MCRLLFMGFMITITFLGYTPDSLAQDHDRQPQIQQRLFVTLEQSAELRHEERDISKLQAGHLANIRAMANDGILYLAGPLQSPDNNHRIRGILIFGPPTKALVSEVKERMNTDPMVAAGLMNVTIHTLLFEDNNSLKHPVRRIE